MFNLFRRKEPGVVVVQDAIASPIPKILKAPKLKPTTCSMCTAIYQGEVTQLEPDWLTIDRVKKTLRCPVCNSLNAVEFEEVSDDTLS